MEDVSTFGRWGVVWIRAAERGGGASNRNPGLESDKLSRAGEQSSGTLQDLRFWETRRAGTRKSRSVGGIRKDGTDGERERERWAASCRVVSWTWRWLTVFERNSGTALWANGARSDWYCGLAGRGRGAGKGAAGHGTETATSAERGWIRFEVQLVVRALVLNRPDNSLNGSQCCVDFGWRVQVEAKVCVHLEVCCCASQDGLAAWMDWMGGTRCEGDAGNWPAHTDEA